MTFRGSCRRFCPISRHPSEAERDSFPSWRGIRYSQDAMVEPQPANTSEFPEAANTEARAVASRLAVHPMKPEETPAAKDSSDGTLGPVNFQQALRPILKGIEAVARAQFEQVDMLDREEKVMMHQTGVPKILAETKVAIEQRNVVNKAMFEALHAELKTYKDAFLLEAVLRPVIRDLISLYDDISDIHRQLALALSSQEQRGNLAGSALIFFENVAAPVSQLEHNRDSVLEILERLGVTLLPVGTGKLDKQAQRAVTVEFTEDPDQDHEVVKIVKRGFLWKDRVIRAEEVVIKKWKEGYLSALGRNPAKP
jgi:molecular chaperone GrpE (heat shock protein)